MVVQQSILSIKNQDGQLHLFVLRNGGKTCVCVCNKKGRNFRRIVVADWRFKKGEKGKRKTAAIRVWITDFSIQSETDGWYWCVRESIVGQEDLDV